MKQSIPFEFRKLWQAITDIEKETNKNLVRKMKRIEEMLQYVDFEKISGNLSERKVNV